ncbi:MAG: hypothetical protein BIFFINMI_02610 [Phycisphaerae bacterium]|nr:hypothetical protein [Phycisphaerae bacterium]
MSKLLSAVCLCLVFTPTLSFADAGPVGWRTDGTGRYPDATPATEWSADKNVVWKTPLDNWSNATPVIVGDRIFVTAEPDKLICLKKSDGSILWTKASPLVDGAPESERAELAKLNEQAGPIRAKLGALTREQKQVYNDLRSLQREIDAANRQKTEVDPAKVKQLDALKQKNQDLSKQVSDLNAKLQPLHQWEMPATHGTNGHSSATPVSDGKCVWVIYNFGVLACYDLEGNRKWIAYVDRPQHEWGECASPVLVDGKILVHWKFMKAFDAASGRLAWTAEGTEWGWGTPAVLRVGGAAVALTSKGDMIAVADGKVLQRGLAKVTFNSPTLSGNLCYWVDEGRASACRLLPGDGGAVKVEKVWSGGPPRDRYYGSPLIQDGLIYVITRGGVFSVIDSADGKVVNGGGRGQNLDKLGQGTCYPSITLAGANLFVSIDNGTTLVMTTGRSPQVVAANKLETFRSCPVFEGKRMYVRTDKHLYCIGQ